MKVAYDTSRAVPEELEPYLIGESPNEEGEWDMFCPLHEDVVRSARFNYIKGVWVCYKSCGGGSVRDLLRRKSEFVPRSAVSSASSHSIAPRSNGRRDALDEEAVRNWAAELIQNEARLTEFQDLRGIWRKTVVDFEIGWDAQKRAYTIPVRDRRGKLVNIRRYQPRPTSGRRKMWSVTGHGQPRLYPIQVLNGTDSVIICEGEMDALITMQNGFPAITRTASAVTWKDEWNQLFKDKLVYVCHDRDKAGAEADSKVIEALSGTAREVRSLRLPFPRAEKHGKDLTDWWLEHDGDRDAFERLMTGAKGGKVIRLPRAKEPKPEPDSEPEADRVKVGLLDLTDDGNARRFIKQHRGRLVYAGGAGWFRWSKQHWSHDRADRRVWKPVPRESILKDVKRTIRTLAEEADRVENPDDRFLLLKHAKRSLATSGLKACRDSVEGGDPDIQDLVISVDELDKNPDIINVANGIVHLPSGRIKPHRAHEFCTMITRAKYNPKADRTEWQQFLNTVMPDNKLQLQLQMCLGATITARPTRGIFVLYGPEGENGKTQLLQAISHALGTYAVTAHESTFTTANAREAGYDMADFRGVRFVGFAETREGHGLASERIKRITGDEPIRARHPYGRFFEYRPHFTLWVSTNHAPYIPAADGAMWKRVWVWPMFEVIAKNKQISDYGRRLGEEHGEAILSWLIDGARTFYLNECRLGRPPDIMDNLRDAWQARDDIILRWLTERTAPTPRGRVRIQDLWWDFKVWCEDQGEQTTLMTYTAQKFHHEIDQRFPEYPRIQKVVKGSAIREGLILNSVRS